MKHRIRIYIAALLAVIVPALSWNAGHTAGLKDMAAEYKREYGSDCVSMKDIDALIAERVR